jgi:hypothetical protein
MTKRSITSRAKKALKDLVYKEFPFMLGHRCGKPAFYMKHTTEDGKPLVPQDIIYPDGSMPRNGDVAKCFSCKEALTHDDLHFDNIVSLQ